mmetsp:Transcript_4743/g.12742  ORF Transcript_4743/g.12742 Transcript_4743/m.12742 type:complete len:249 (-) Transcript_4743:72-818(-)
MVRRCPARRRLHGRCLAFLAVGLYSLGALTWRTLSFAAGISAGRRVGRGSSLSRRAEAPELTPEPDFKEEIGPEVRAMMADSLGIDTEKTLSVVNRVTPIDKWFGWDRHILGARDGDDPFVDSSDESSYVTLTLEKPLGIQFEENSEEEGLGAAVEEVKPGYSAFATGLVRSGYQLIIAENTPVYGLPLEEAVKPIMDKDGPVKLTFFVGDPEFFYGDFKPSQAWLAEFIEKARGLDPPVVGPTPEFQ